MPRRDEVGAVLASLWDLNDDSTGRLMADFYRRWKGTKGISKAQALREAQLTLLQSADSDASGKADRGTERADASQPRSGSPYSHPYYWAPFILMGNWQ
jgi:CHAT domain-containing protein